MITSDQVQVSIMVHVRRRNPLGSMAGLVGYLREEGPVAPAQQNADADSKTVWDGDIQCPIAVEVRRHESQCPACHRVRYWGCKAAIPLTHVDEDLRHALKGRDNIEIS